MAAKSSLVNMVLCLTLVCLLCSAILGVVYTMTEQPIKDASQKALTEALSSVVPDHSVISTQAQFIDVEGVNYEYYMAYNEENEAEYAIAVKSTVNGFGGPLTVLVGVMYNGTVFSTKVLSHSETPGLGAKCSDMESHFVLQFVGFDPAQKKLVVTKDGGDVDAITASTITSRAYTAAVAAALKVYEALKGTAGLNSEEETSNE